MRVDENHLTSVSDVERPRLHGAASHEASNSRSRCLDEPRFVIIQHLATTFESSSALRASDHEDHDVNSHGCNFRVVLGVSLAKCVRASRRCFVRKIFIFCPLLMRHVIRVTQRHVSLETVARRRKPQVALVFTPQLQ